jgi:hypothetical protein
MTRLKSAKQSAKMENQLRTFEDNQTRFKGMVEQPLILALKSSNPETAIELLERGADPNSVTCSSQYYIQATWQSRFTGESALDVADNQLNALRDYKRDPTPARPSMPEGADIYLKKFKEGTYEHWVVSECIEGRRKSYLRDLKRYEKNKTPPASAPGLEKKEAAIAEAIKTMEKVKEALLAKGAKTFVEIYPRFLGLVDKPNRHRRYTVDAQNKVEPFKYTFSFRNVTDVTEARKNAYLKL